MIPPLLSIIIYHTRLLVVEDDPPNCPFYGLRIPRHLLCLHHHAQAYRWEISDKDVDVPVVLYLLLDDMKTEYGIHLQVF